MSPQGVVVVPNGDVTGPGQHSGKNRWNCHGCGDSSDRPEQDYLFRIRPDANRPTKAIEAARTTTRAAPAHVTTRRTCP
ncbi:hypothetical protein ACFT8W_00440 [Streptomyces hygroscopicus]|uniref:hypothetical protein n=1 Tax=Streptomyces hygroscopicus TaxID=1912 RepID=UPI00363B5A82